MRLSTATDAKLIPVLCHLLRKLPRSSCVWRERRLDNGPLVMEHTPRINGCQHRGEFPASARLSPAQPCHPPMRKAAVAAASKGVLHPSLEERVMGREDDQEHDRLFTISEANHLIPQLNTRIASVRQAKAVVARTRDDIRRASARAEYGGGSSVGPLYISSLHQISQNLQAIQEMGVLVKDVDLGLCDFPHLRDGRVVFLCWKYGEPEIKWWHETTTGYKDRCPLEGSA